MRVPPFAARCIDRSSAPRNVVKHYTQLPSELKTSTDVKHTFVHVRGGGFVTQDMLVATLDQWISGAAMPGELLVDLRDVAGYESGCAELAQQFLDTAVRSGVRRIAFVATSAVLRTAARLVLSGNGSVRVRFFHDEHAAKRWLERDESPRVQPLESQSFRES